MSETARPRTSSDGEAEELWSLLVELGVAHVRTHFQRVIAELDLSPPQAYALRRLEPERPLPMRDLADGLACDASNVTGIVDRLERRGLVERQVSSSDRRVKTLVVTAQGVAVRARLLRRLHQVPDAVAELSPEERRLLCGVLRRILGEPSRRG
jgi:MarR family transcriptional regulator, organic hydroperoxide resistance regulator